MPEIAHIFTTKSTPPVIGQVSFLAQTKTTQNVNVKPDAKNSISAPCSFFKDFERCEPKTARIIRKHADHEEVVPTTNNVNIRQAKGVTDFVYPSEDDPIMKMATTFTKRHLAYMKAPVKSVNDETEFKGGSAAGIIGKNTGTPKTEEYLQSPLFEQYKWNTDHIPIQVVNTKDEFLSPEDLARNKIRFVDNVGKEFLFKQKILFDNQNKKLIKHCNEAWIKYGLSKQFGGFDRLCASYEKCSLISFSDISGYDIASVLETVYKIRLFLLDISAYTKDDLSKEFLSKIVNHVLYYTLNPVRLHPNGQIFQFDKSNSSGQNNTAPDNSILHELITFYLNIVVWYDMFHRYPTYEELIEHLVVSLYSDDKAVGYIAPFVPTVTRLKELEMDVYKRFGMTIKESASRIITHVPGELFNDGEFEFLGSYNKWIDEGTISCYWPLPRERKLATSATKVLTCTKDQLDPLDHYLKLVQLETQLQYTELAEPMTIYRKWFENKYTHLNLSDDIDRIEFLNSIDSISRKGIEYLITGQESSFKSFRLNFIFFSIDCGGRLVLKLNTGMSQNNRNMRKKTLPNKLTVKKPTQPKSNPHSSTKARAVLTSKHKSHPKSEFVPFHKRERGIANPSRPPPIRNAKSKKKHAPHTMKEKKTWWDSALDAAVPLLAKYGPELIAGFGDYEVQDQQSNSVLAASTNGSYGAVPMVENTKKTNDVQHREYIGDVNGSTSTFNLATYPINPGLDDTFPWLAPQAACYTGYRVKGMLFEFISDASEFSATPYLGYVAMGTQYDSIDPAYPSKREMLNSEFSNSGKPSENLLHPVECAKAENVLSQLYIRTSNSGSATSDKRFFDLGKFSIATGGQQSNGKIGELWATYDIEFFKPKLSHTTGTSVECDAFELETVTNIAPLGTTTGNTDYPNNTLGGYVASNGTTYVFPPSKSAGHYMLETFYSGVAAVVVASAYTYTNCEVATAPWEPGTQMNSPSAISSIRMMSRTYVKVTGENATIAFGPATLPTTLTSANLIVVQIPSLMFGETQEPDDEDEEDEEFAHEEQVQNLESRVEGLERGVLDIMSKLDSILTIVK